MKSYLKELPKFLKIGIPIYGSQASYIAMSVTDTLVAGNAGKTELAGVAIASAIGTPLFFAFSGLIFAVTPIIAQLHGGQRFKEISSKMKEILWIALTIGILLFGMYQIGGWIINLYGESLLDLEKPTIRVIDGYLNAVSFGVIAMVMFTALRCFSEGLTKTLPVFLVAFGGMIINIPLDIILVYGLFGLPKMGGIGCGIATSIVYVSMMFAFLILMVSKESYRRFNIFSKIRLPQKSTIVEILKLGIPIGLGIFIELSMFSGAALILAPLGDIVIASHSIALNIASFAFVMPLSIGLAAATRVGNLIGANNLKGAKLSSQLTLSIGFIGAVFNTIIILIFNEFLAGLYSNEIVVIALASKILILAAVFQLPDGIQMGAAGALRGYKDTFIPMLLLLIAYWGFGLPIGFILTHYGLNEPMGVFGMWIGMIIGLTVFAIMVVMRLNYIVNKSVRAI